MTRITLRATKELDYCLTVDVPEDQIEGILHPESDDVIGDMLEGLTPVSEAWVDARAEQLDSGEQPPLVQSSHDGVPTITVCLEEGRITGVLSNQPVRVLLSDGDRDHAESDNEVMAEGYCVQDVDVPVDPSSVLADMDAFAGAQRNKASLESDIVQLSDATLLEYLRRDIPRGVLSRWDGCRVEDPSIIGEVRLEMLKAARSLSMEHIRSWRDVWKLMVGDELGSSSYS